MIADPAPGARSWLLVWAVVGASFIASAQWFASARAIAAWVAYALVFLACRRLRGRDTGAVTLAVVAGGTILALHGLYQDRRAHV